jgi:hypothetical protein
MVAGEQTDNFFFDGSEQIGHVIQLRLNDIIFLNPLSQSAGLKPLIVFDNTVGIITHADDIAFFITLDFSDIVFKVFFDTSGIPDMKITKRIKIENIRAAVADSKRDNFDFPHSPCYQYRLKGDFVDIFVGNVHKVTQVGK